MSGLTDRQQARLTLRDNLPIYTAECLKIRPKEGQPAPLRFNRVQMRLHELLEDQLKKTGSVRALILKGRQMGISTYVGARFYHKTTHKRGMRTFILTHLDDASDNLFGMVKRFHDNCPAEVRPQTGTASAKELSFPVLDSGYKVGTAGNKAVGRSDTIQLFHGSEMAFWPNADEHSRGIAQAIGDVDGTEDIRESTANGIGNAFHSMWKAAEKGDSRYICIFLPWFWHDAYTTPAPAEWGPPPDFIDYGEAYSLTRNQLYWAWLKNRELAASISADPDKLCWSFKQEYPANAAEAFQTSGANQFIPPEVVLKARKRRMTGMGPVILGIDPSHGGKDKLGIIDRQGRVMGANICKRLTTSRNVNANVGMVIQEIKQLRQMGVNIRKICVDAEDYAFFCLLEEAIGGDICVPVMFGEQAYDPKRYANRRAEMADIYREWFNDPVGVSVPDDDGFQGDATCTSWGPGATHKRPNGQLVLEPKDKIKERLKASPDLGFDAAMLTFGVDFSELTEDASMVGASGGQLGANAWLG